MLANYHPQVPTLDNVQLTQTGGFVTGNNNMNSKVNKQYDEVPENLGVNGKTPSGKPRLFVCGVCTRAFARQEHLKRHERSHTKEKPFECGVCTRKFSRRDLLLRHAQKLHAGMDEAIETIIATSKKRKDSMSPPRRMRKPSKVMKPTKPHPRRASFSAQSAANYAHTTDDNSAKQAEVEFSTPQLRAMDGFSLEDDDIEFYSLQSKDNWVNQVNQGNQNPENFAGFNTSFSFGKPEPRSTIYDSSKSLFGQPQHISPASSDSNSRSETKNDYNPGFSYYGDNDSLARQMSELQFGKDPAAFLMNAEDSSTNSHTSGSGNTFHKLDDVLLGDKFMREWDTGHDLEGYSFYGNLDGLAEKNGLTISPRMLDGAPPVQNLLFSGDTIKKIGQTLAKYPFVALETPQIPNLRLLNLFIDKFKSKFLCHFPIIHESLLNEEEMERYTTMDDYVNQVPGSGDDDLQNASRVCLPLLMATIGALHSSEADSMKSAADLFEASRRCIHVYLDARKKRKADTQSPIWLVQSLILSVSYGLFADSEPSSTDIGVSSRVDTRKSVIVKQVAALCSLVKSSGMNRSNPLVLTEEEWETPLGKRKYLIHQSAIRSVLMVYGISEMMRIYYEIDNGFLNREDVLCTFIPDYETNWRKLYNPNLSEISMDFSTFLESLQMGTFLRIPESLALCVLLAEYGNHQTGDLFLTKIDTSSLEMKLSYIDVEPTTSGKCLRIDAITMKNSLMTMKYFEHIKYLGIGNSIWSNNYKSIFHSFFATEENVLNGPYNQLTDFLVALSYSCKNLYDLFSYGKIIDTSRLSLLNTQAYFYNFLVVIKFLEDFESNPNFKLLSIYAELNKLLHGLLIPKLSKITPHEFVNAINPTMNHRTGITPTQSVIGLTHLEDTNPKVKVENIERLINNVLVHAFNDVSYLKNVYDMPLQQQGQQFPLQLSLNSNSNSTLNLLTNDRAFVDKFQLAKNYTVVAKSAFKYIFRNFLPCQILLNFYRCFEGYYLMKYPNPNSLEVLTASLMEEARCKRDSPSERSKASFTTGDDRNDDDDDHDDDYEMKEHHATQIQLSDFLL